jgi:peptide/nickel transport system ATP-binding protein
MVMGLEVTGLSVSARPGEALLDRATFELAPGERKGLIGASGSGKSLTAGALSGLLRPPLRLHAEVMRFAGHDLNRLSPQGWRALRGRTIFQIFQSPGTALNPARRVGAQLAEAAKVARACPVRDVAAALQAVALDPEVARRFPYQLSGGMKQRVLIALALLLRPRLLIADEPTTGLDVLTEREILDALSAMLDATGASLLFISHDLRAVRAVAPRTLVMQAGRILEDTPIAGLAASPHRATRALAGAAAALEVRC